MAESHSTVEVQEVGESITTDSVTPSMSTLHDTYETYLNHSTSVPSTKNCQLVSESLSTPSSSISSVNRASSRTTFCLGPKARSDSKWREKQAIALRQHVHDLRKLSQQRSKLRYAAGRKRAPRGHQIHIESTTYVRRVEHPKSIFCVDCHCKGHADSKVHQHFHQGRKRYIEFRRGVPIYVELRNGRFVVTKPPTLVNNKISLWEMLEVLEETPVLPLMEPSLCMDGEGGEVYGKGGSLYLWQIYVKPADEVYIIDVLTLGDLAFSSRHPVLGVSFRDVLESDRLIKAFWDVRKDSEMLSDYGVVLNAGSVIDLQLMEVAARASWCSIRYCIGYGKAVMEYAGLGSDDLDAFFVAKNFGKNIFDARNFSVLRRRPLAPKFIEYSAADVKHMPAIWKYLQSGLSARRFEAVIDGSRDRVNGLGNTDGALSPWVKFGEQGVEAPWLYDERHYLSILQSYEIDNRPDREESHAEMLRQFEKDELERTAGFDKKYRVYYAGIRGWIRKRMDLLYIWSGIKSWETWAEKNNSWLAENWTERKWRLENGLGVTDTEGKRKRFEVFETFWE